jgi:hypothetical protein
MQARLTVLHHDQRLALLGKLAVELRRVGLEIAAIPYRGIWPKPAPVLDLRHICEFKFEVRHPFTVVRFCRRCRNAGMRARAQSR